MIGRLVFALLLWPVMWLARWHDLGWRRGLTALWHTLRGAWRFVVGGRR